MFVPFETMPDRARVWIYPSKQKLTQLDREKITTHLTEFSQRWAAHGQPLKSSFQILFNQFIVLVADEQYNAASGCSIDDSVRAVKKLEQMGIELLNRDVVAFKKGDEIELISLGDLKEKYQAGIWSKDSLTFNNLVNNIGELEKNWIVPAGKTWLNRYLPREAGAS